MPNFRPTNVTGTAKKKRRTGRADHGKSYQYQRRYVILEIMDLGSDHAGALFSFQHLTYHWPTTGKNMETGVAGDIPSYRCDFRIKQAHGGGIVHTDDIQLNRN